MKKNRNLKKFLPFLLSIVLSSQVGCSNTEVVDTKDVSISEISDDIDETKEVAVNREVQNDCSNHYSEFFSSYNVNFNDESVLSDDEINSIYERLDSVVECSFNGNDDVDTLYNKVKNNSFRYINEHSEYRSCFGDDLGDIEQEVIFRDIFYSVVREHFNTYSENRKNDMCRMQTLKIVYDDNEEDESMLGLYDEQKNIIFLYRMNIEQYALDLLRKEKNDIDRDLSVYENFMKDCLKNVFGHELAHVLQSICDCNAELKGKNSLSYEEICGKEYYVSLLEEASAESYFNSNQLYEYERMIQGLFWLMSLFEENVTINDYHSAMGSNDINNILEFFELTPNEFFRLLYIIDGINFRNDLYKEYEKKFGSIDTSGEGLEFKTWIGSGYKAEIFRIILERMVIYTNNNPDFRLEENLFLFNFIKNKVFYDSKNYDRNSNVIKDDKFVNDVVELEETYIDFLASHYMEGRNEDISYIRDMEEQQKGLFVILYDIIMDKDISNYGNDKLKIIYDLLDRFPLFEHICNSFGKKGNILGYEYYIKETYGLKKVKN